jgi:hypothetical protein
LFNALEGFLELEMAASIKSSAPIKLKRIGALRRCNDFSSCRQLKFNGYHANSVSPVKSTLMTGLTYALVFLPRKQVTTMSGSLAYIRSLPELFEAAGV